VKGVVTKSTGSWHEVWAEGKRYQCRIRGKIRLDEIKETNPVTVGDHVEFEVEETESSGEGNLSGSYTTAVGNVIVAHPLRGRWCETKEGALVGWTVMWTKKKNVGDPNSSASWSGRLIVPLKNGKRQDAVIKTTWLLTKADRADWDSTLTNQDQFRPK